MNIREDAAKYYDIQGFPIDDVDFYKSLVPSPSARVLELGCGTGRVLIPLAEVCGFIHGIDSSEAMLEICSTKLESARLPAGRAKVTLGDITNLELEDQFDLIIAPFRVMQTLETDAEVLGMMDVITRCLAPGGSAILNTFFPNRGPDEMRRSWCSQEENLTGESILEDGSRFVRSDRRPRLQSDPLVLFPELIYRTYSPSGDLVDEAILKIAMRCWYPAELEKLVTDNGFKTVAKWGGYHGEPWAQGPELVIQFAR